MRLRPQRERKHLLVERRIVSHWPTICGDIEDVAQVSITSRSGVKLVLPHAQAVVGWRSVGSMRQVGVIGQDGRAAGVAVPHRERHAKVALARDAPVPVADSRPTRGSAPPCAPDASVICSPASSSALLEVEHADEPLPRHQILHRRIAALVHAHRLRLRLSRPAADPALLQLLRRSRARASLVVSPARSPASAVRRPSRPMIIAQRQVDACATTRRRSHRQRCSTSPRPCPFSGSASGSASTGTLRPKSGT